MQASPRFAAAAAAVRYPLPFGNDPEKDSVSSSGTQGLASAPNAKPSDEFVNDMTKAYNSIPAYARNLLAAKGIQVVLASDITKALPKLNTIKGVVTGPGIPARNVDELRHGKTIYIGEKKTPLAHYWNAIVPSWFKISNDLAALKLRAQVARAYVEESRLAERGNVRHEWRRDVIKLSDGDYSDMYPYSESVDHAVTDLLPCLPEWGGESVNPMFSADELKTAFPNLYKALERQTTNTKK